MYRLVRLQKRALHRKTPPALKKPGQGKTSGQERIVSAPNQIWNWDITCLKGPKKRPCLYLYLMMDVFSRRIMGWRLHVQERAEHAAKLIRTVCQENGIKPVGLVLHSDNGRPMRGGKMLGTLRRLGIIPSFSRPRVRREHLCALPERSDN